MRLTSESIILFKENLVQNEKATATITKYVNAIIQLQNYLNGQEIEKEILITYRQWLQQTLKVTTVNGRLTAINSYLAFMGLQTHKIKLVKIQHQVFIDESRELSRDEYFRLLTVAKETGKKRLYLAMQTLGSTGMRVGELQFITVKAALTKRANISFKGKNRIVILQQELADKLLAYAAEEKITFGPIFRTKNGHPLDRSNIFHDMKKMCNKASVNPQKVFPHNLRHLFARCYYDIDKDISRLADILGHSRIETTRAYVAVSTTAHEQILSKMDLIK